MATVRISQLTAITAPTDDDVLIINDADTNTRKITFANLTQNLVNTTAATQTKSGALTVSGTLTAGSNFVVDTNTFFVDSVTNRVGVRTISPNTEFDIDGAIHIRNSNTLQFGDANDSNYVSLGAPSVIASNFALTLPAALPAANNLLWSDGSGNLGFTTGITYDSGTQAVALGGAWFTNQGSVRFYEQSLNGSEYVGFTAPANLSSTTGYTLPGTYPASNGYVLSSTTGGVLSWVSNSASAAGNAGDVQFSDGSALTANSNFNFNNGSQTLSVPNLVVGTLLQANGNVALGNASGDDITFFGSAASNLQPKTTGVYDLGTSVLHWGEVHVDDLYAYGNIELGNATTDTISINGRVDSNVTPEADLARDLGAPALQWSRLYVGDIFSTGNVQLGNTAGDVVTFNGTLTGSIVPTTTNTSDLGSASARFANAHVNQLFTYGSTTIGDSAADPVFVNGVFQSDLVPSGTFDIGTAAAPWAEVHAGDVIVQDDVSVAGDLTQAGLTRTSVVNDTVRTSIPETFDLGPAADFSGYKVIVVARDTINGDREMFEYLAVNSGGAISEVIGSNVQAPTPGTFLVAASGSQPGSNFILTVTNVAASGNDIAFTLQIVSIEA